MIYCDYYLILFLDTAKEHLAIFLDFFFVTFSGLLWEGYFDLK